MATYINIVNVFLAGVLCAALVFITKRVCKMATALEDLTEVVGGIRDTATSAAAALDGLKAQLDAVIAAGNNDPALLALRDDLAATKANLADAIARDTGPSPTGR